MRQNRSKLDQGLFKQRIATIGENMKVTRFVQFNLGEGLEKKSQDFAAEVATQIVAKPVISPVKEEPAAVEAKETGMCIY